MTSIFSQLSPAAQRQYRIERVKQRAYERQQETEAELLRDPVRWIETHFYIPELEGPIQLYPYQKAVLREANRRDAAGRYVYNLILWSDIKKSAKSSIAAAMAMYRARATKWGSVKIIANDLKQADSRVAYYFRRSLELHPDYEQGQNYRKAHYKISFDDNHSAVEAIPIDPGGEAGGNDDLIIFSELWAARHKAIQQMWTEMTIPPNKFGHAQRWVETYAGFRGESPILEQLYERCVEPDPIKRAEKGIEQLDLSYTDADGRFHDLRDLEVFAVDGILCLWNTRPRLPWQTADYYAAESAILIPTEFSRIHRNDWASSTSKFVPDGWWEACEGTLPKFRRRDPMIIAMDAAVSGDTFGVVGTTTRKNHSYVRYANAWRAPQEGKIDYQGTVEAPGPEREVVRLCFFHNVSEVRYDPYQLHDMATRLAGGVYVDANGNICEKSKAVRKLKINMVEFKQGEPRLKADKQLYDKIRERRITHDGTPDLETHVKNANQKSDNGRMRIVKRSESLPIDLAVATSMSSYEEEPEQPKKANTLAQGKTKGWQPRR